MRLNKFALNCLCFGLASAAYAQQPPDLNWQQPHGSQVYAVAISEDGQTVASGGESSVIRLFNTSDGAPKGVISEHTWAINSLAYTRGGRYLISGSRDGTVRAHYTPENRLAAVMAHGDIVLRIATATDGKTIASGGQDGQVKIWKLPKGIHLRTIQTPAYVNGLDFSPDGQLIAAGCWDGTVRVFQVRTGQLVQVLTSNLGQWINWTKFSEDGNRIVATDYGGNLTTWTTSDGWQNTDSFASKRVESAPMWSANFHTRFGEETLLAVGESGNIYAFDSSLTRLLWKRTAPHQVDCIAVQADKFAYGSFTAQNVSLATLPREGIIEYALGRPRSQAHGIWEAPVLAKGIGRPSFIVQVVSDSGLSNDVAMRPEKSLSEFAWSQIGWVGVPSANRLRWTGTLSAFDSEWRYIGQIEAAMTPFEVHLHGFHFDNVGQDGFPLDPLYRGACAGMVQLAKEMFLSGEPIPPDEEFPSVGSHLWNRIRDAHLLLTLRTQPAIARSALWPSDLVAWNEEYSRVRNRNRQGEPSSVVLFDPATDAIRHAVLSIGSIEIDNEALGNEESDSGPANHLWIYDPNWKHNRDRWLSARQLNEPSPILDLAGYVRVASAED